MVKYCVLFLLNIMWVHTVNAQVPKGYFTGGFCNTGAEYCGDWFVTADSNFYFLAFSNEMLEKIGRGKLIKYAESVAFFEFDNEFDIPNRLTYTYSASSRKSADSIYINLRLKNFDKTKVLNPFIVSIGDKYLGPVNRNGVFKEILAKKGVNRFGTLYLSGRTGTAPLQFFLNPAANYHEIDISYNNDDASCRSIGLKYDTHKKDTVHFRVINKNADTVVYFLNGLLPVHSMKSALLTKLEKAKGKQTYLKTTINKIIIAIKKE